MRKYNILDADRQFWVATHVIPGQYILLFCLNKYYSTVPTETEADSMFSCHADWSARNQVWEMPNIY